jgi:hypothetical protein
LLESEGILLPVPFEEMDEYIEKKVTMELKNLDEVKQRKEHDRIIQMMRRDFKKFLFKCTAVIVTAWAV